MLKILINTGLCPPQPALLAQRPIRHGERSTHVDYRETMLIRRLLDVGEESPQRNCKRNLTQPTTHRLSSQRILVVTQEDQQHPNQMLQQLPRALQASKTAPPHQPGLRVEPPAGCVRAPAPH